MRGPVGHPAALAITKIRVLSILEEQVEGVFIKCTKLTWNLSHSLESFNTFWPLEWTRSYPEQGRATQLHTQLQLWEADLVPSMKVRPPKRPQSESAETCMAKKSITANFSMSSLPALDLV
jgi:hypothetical protein